MSVEPLLLAVVSLLGSSVVVWLGRRSLLDHAALALPCGLALFSAVALVGFVSPLHYRPGPTALVAAVLAAVLVVSRLQRVPEPRRLLALTPALAWAVVVGLISLSARWLSRTRVTADSYEYIQGAGLFEAVGSPFADAYLLVARQGAMAIVHSLALVGGEPYLVGLAPALAVSVGAGLIWFARSLAGRLGPLEWTLLTALLLALATANRVVFNAFYVNAHLLVGAMILMIVGVTWSIAQGHLAPRWIVVPCLLLVPVVLARPESPVLLAIVLTGLVLGTALEARAATALVTTSVATTWVWWAGGLGDVADLSPLGEGTVALTVATATLGLLVLPRVPACELWLRRWLPWAVQGVLLLALLAFTIADDDGMLTTNLAATWNNLRGEGMWGWLPGGLILLVVAVSVLRRPPAPQAFLLPLTTFLPLALVLAFARDGAFRLGPGDSLNRMWLHIVPLAVAYVITASTSACARGGRRQEPSGSRAASHPVARPRPVRCLDAPDVAEMSEQDLADAPAVPPEPERSADAPVAETPWLGRLNTRGFRLVMVADVIVLLAVTYGTMFVRFGTAWPIYPVPTYLVSFTVAIAIFMAALYFGGLYEREPRLGAPPALPRAARQTMAAGGLVALLTLVTTGVAQQLGLTTERALPFPITNLVVLIVLGAVGVAGNRWLAHTLRTRREGPPKVLLVGDAQDLVTAREHLGNGTQVRIVGELEATDDVLEAVRERGATDVMLLSRHWLDPLYPGAIETLERSAVTVLLRVTARETMFGLERVREVGGMPFVLLRAQTVARSRARFKRLFDLVLLAVTAPLWLTLLGLVSLYQLLVAGRPLLFWQTRVGAGAQLFRMVKFRTMVRDAEADGRGARLAEDDDPRIIGACRWVRAARMDELPQLWNVLRGEMSLVGPRPERPELTAQFERAILGYGRRHELPPGLTGLAQIHGRYHTDAEYKLGYDLQYLVNWSPVLDLEILLRTVWVVLARRL